MADTAKLDVTRIANVRITSHDSDAAIGFTTAELENLSEPTASTSAATKNYVDTNGLGADPVDVTDATVSLTQALHAGKVVTLNRADGIAVTLPLATGTGDVYTLRVGTTFTSAASIAVPSAVDSMIGNAVLFADSGDTVVGFSAAADTDTIDMLGTSNSTGGLLGAKYVLTDIGAALWGVDIVSDAGGTEATPFSENVS